MNSLFGVELPPFVTFIIAFVIVLALIGAAAWLVRRFGAARLAAGRGRQPRLAVIDAAAVDGRRKLIIIRRDNVEHLLMIGGPSDVVVETNILRAVAANQRDATTPRASTDSLPRAPALPDTSAWPLPPEPTLAPRAERPRVLPEEPFAVSPPPMPIPPPPTPVPVRTEPLVRAQIPNDPLMGLAAELSRAKSDATVRPPEPPRASLAPAYQNGETPIAPTAPTASAAPLAPDAHLAEMAHRLETALRRPLSQSAQTAKSEMPQRPLSATDQRRAETRPGASNGAPTNGNAGNGAQGKTVYESLEQEMASLLGRQSGKT
jgi:flagellar biogenesis protein FliO